VAATVDAGRPAEAGVFTEDHCEEHRGRGGTYCTSIGTWVSDDGEVTLEPVILDGSPDTDGRVRAIYRPGSLLGGDEVVHTGGLDAIGPFVTWGFAVFIAALGVRYCRPIFRRWRRRLARSKAGHQISS